MLAAIFSQFGMSIINGMLDKALEAFKAYENKQISVEQLKDQLYGIMVQAVKEVEIAHAEAITKMYQSLMGAAVQSPLIARTWAFVTISQGMMLLWFQFGIPFIIAAGWVKSWPSAGSTADWAYALVGGLLGLGMTLGKSSGSIADKFKSMIGK
jgi:hypothetical protein